MDAVKSNSKRPWLRWLLLLVLVGASVALLYQKRTARSKAFKSKLIAISEEAISDVYMTRDKEEVRLTKNASGVWRLRVNENKEVKTESSRVQNLLKQLSHLEVLTLYSRNRTHWKAHQLEDSTGLRVRLFVKGKEKADVIIGRIDVDRDRQSIYSYARLADGTDTYTISGTGYGIQANADFYRDKVLLNYAVDSLKRIRFESTGAQFSVRKQGQSWYLDENVAADSARIATYLQETQRIESSGFDDALVINTPPTSRVIFEVKGGTPIEIGLYEVPNQGAYLRSTRLPESLVQDQNAQHKIFKSKTFFQ